MTHRLTGRLFWLLTIVMMLGFFPNSIGAAQNASHFSSVRKEKEPNKPVLIVEINQMWQMHLTPGFLLLGGGRRNSTRRS